MRAVLITGCSAGGIGSSLATAFQRHGYHVFATARSVSKMSHLASLPNMTLLTLEVTSSTSIQAAVAAVEDSGHRLEVLVNNAGIAPVMPLLDQDMAGAREVFETNVWGGLALVQAFKEVLVSGGGCVVNVGSMNALAVPAWMGVYNASKAAQHVLMETLRIELEPLGVRVLTVVTGAIDTVVMTKQAGTFRLPEDSMYTAIEGKLRERAEGHEVVPRTTPDDYAEVSRDEQGWCVEGKK